MQRESKYTAIILKKQPYGESDEIITFFTEQQGKIRALAKAVKAPKSKLQSSLQSLFLVRLALSFGQLPKIISVEPVEVFAVLRENLRAAKMAFYAAELTLKFTPDEHKNQQLFEALINFLMFLNAEHGALELNFALAKFKVDALNSLGFNIHYPKESSAQFYFSPSRGGFFGQKTGDSIAARKPVYDLFLALKAGGWTTIAAMKPSSATQELQDLLSLFIEYQLERKLKSEKFLNML